MVKDMESYYLTITNYMLPKTIGFVFDTNKYDTKTKHTIKYRYKML